jgi:hypothetical protein
VEHFIPWPAEASQHIPSENRFQLTSMVAPDVVAQFSEQLSGVTPLQIIETFAGECFQACYECGEVTRLFIETGPAPNRKYVLLQHGNEVLVVLASTERSLLTHLVRCLREIYLRRMEALGAISLHAGAVALGDDCVLMVGDKSMGKTSLVLALSLDGGNRYLANDRAIVLRDGASFIVYPFPLACRVAIGTARGIAILAPLLRRGDSLHRTQHEYFLPGSQSASEPGADVKLEITPYELVHRFGLRHAPAARLRRVIIPEVSAAYRSPAWVPLSREEAFAALAAQLQTPREEKWVNPWLVDRGRSDASLATDARELLIALAAAIPVGRLRFGYDYHREGSLHGEIRALLAGGA